MTARKLQKCEAYVQTAARGVLSVSLVAILLSSTALAQEMGGAMGPGSEWGDEPSPDHYVGDGSRRNGIVRTDGVAHSDDPLGSYDSLRDSAKSCERNKSLTDAPRDREEHRGC
jgi:hypothetical protein